MARLKSLAALALCAALAVIATAEARAAEIPPPFFTQFPEAPAALGSGAGQLSSNRGVAFNSLNNHIYVAETANRRISEFTPWGEFVRAFGWGVESGAAELQTCTEASGCQAGLTGSGPGQFGHVPFTSQLLGPTGLAVDSAGDLYAMDLGNRRVQKFDSDGNFILTFGGKVNETTGGDVCAKASGDTCVGGQPGTGPGEFSIENVSGVIGDYLAVGPDDTVWVGDKDRIQAFEPDGTFKASFALPEPGNPGALEVGPDGMIYFAYNQGVDGSPPTQPKVLRFKASGEQIFPPLEVSRARGIAVAPDGMIYVGDQLPFANATVKVFDAAGSQQAEFGELASSGIEITGLASGVVGASGDEYDVYVSEFRFGVSGGLGAVKAYGAIPDPGVVGPPPSVPPAIAEQFAAAVGADHATLKAKINPKFWNDTTYYLEYGPADCATSSCAKAPASPLLLTNKVISEPVLGTGIAIEGLAPRTTYHYRFLAASGGDPTPTVGPDRTFTTTAAGPPPVAPCPNDAFRTGAGALLPDCRAYEMVSPVDKLGANVVPLFSPESLPAAIPKSAAAGGRFTYSAAKSFGEAVSSPYSSQYLTVRDSVGGWAGKSISPPRAGPTLTNLVGLDVQFKLFDEALCGAWFYQDTALSLAPQAVPGYANLYRQDLCASDAYEALTRAKPAAQPPANFLLEIQGAGGGHTVFRANDSLIPGVAPPGEAAKVYDYFNGGLSYVCVLPNGTPVAGGCSVGTAGLGVPTANTYLGQVKNAVSADGKRIYWSASSQEPGKLYLRQAGASLAVSKSAARFWAASTSGDRVIFTEGSDLYAFEPEQDLAEAGELITGGVLGVAGASEDARVVYFVSTQELDAGATAGAPNLYRHQRGGGFELIATLSASDVNVNGLSPIHEYARKHAAKASPSGNALAFISSNALTGQDNLDVKNGKPTSQVYLYDADLGELHCVSCNETGARPAARNIISEADPFWAAATLPLPTNQLYHSRLLSADGKRLYFNAIDPLSVRDTNGAMDVYQWEAEGKGECEEPGGCVRLISSGKNQVDSEFLDASAEGTDVFFRTEASLVAQDPGLIDIYDARVGGGFPPPPAPAPECIGEACQSPAPPPQDPTPSSAVPGPGNLRENRKPKPCAKDKHKVKQKNGRTVCAKKKKGAKSKKSRKGQRAAKGGRAGR